MKPLPVLRDQILAELVQHADPAYRDLVHRRYNMDVSSFLGVRTPVVHQIANRHYRTLKPLPVDERLVACHLLLEAGTYEMKIAAFRWAHLCRNDLHAAHLPVLAGWLARYIDDWIDCDDLCIHVLGEVFLRHPDLAQETRAWTGSANRWVRRGAAVALVLPARRGQQLTLTFDIADLLLEDTDDLVQKAYGWLLKEASKAHPHEVFRYVVERREAMPRIAFRYALEKLPDDLRSAAIRAEPEGVAEAVRLIESIMRSKDRHP